MGDFLAKFNGGELIGLVAVLIGPLIAIVGIVATQWRRVRVAEIEATLKQQMLDKGMSADEIEQVMMSGNRQRPGSKAGSSGDEAQDKAALAQQMIDNGYEGEDIERVLKAYQPPAKQANDKQAANQA